VDFSSILIVSGNLVLTVKIDPSQIVFVSKRTNGGSASNARCLCGRKIQVQLLDDLLGNLVLNSKKVVVFQVDGPCSQDSFHLHIYQLVGNAQILIFTKESTRQQRVDFQIPGDGLIVQ
jgi:hypothetical protein